MDNKNNLLFLTPSERTGSTWLLRLLYSHPEVIAKTEPLRQQLPSSNPVHPFSGKDTDLPEMDVLFSDSQYATQWWKQFKMWFSSEHRVTVLKETNLFFKYSWLVEQFKDDGKILILNRDVRGIASSFKRGNLHYRWNYQEVFQRVKRSILNHKALLEEYGPLLEIFDQGNEMSVISFLYALNSNEMLKSVKCQTSLYLQYEAIRENPEREVAKILSLLDLPITTEVSSAIHHSNQIRYSGDEGDHDHATSKRSDMDDWRFILTSQDVEDIHNVIDQAFTLLVDLKAGYEKKLYRPYGLDGMNCTKTTPKFSRVGFTVSSKERLLEKPVHLCKLGRNDVISVIQDSLVTVPDVKRGFSVSRTMVTNEQFASFLNWLSENGISNVLDDHYLLVNSEMVADRGGRVFKVEECGQYGVLKGYEDHPVNWIYYAGAELFSHWVGGRLISTQEYDELEKHSLKQGCLIEDGQNTGNQFGDTRAVNYDSSAIKDLKGNVLTWTATGSSMDQGFNIRIAKGGAFNAPYRPLGHELIKPVIFSGRDLGIRIACDGLILSPPKKSEFIDHAKRFINELFSSEITQ